jgi:hypothetical protein
MNDGGVMRIRNGSVHPCAVATIAALLFSLPTLSFADASADAKRRTEISNKGRALFKNTKNHCRAFRDLVVQSVALSKSTGEVLEDLKFVLIGEDLHKRRTGPYYIGKESGATGDSGFKAELKDGSPQVEHAMAAIYVGKFFPPGSAEAAALLTEFAQPLATGGKVNPADALLWSIGGDIGQRVSDRELSRFPTAIERTMCD